MQVVLNILLSHIPVENLCDDDWQHCEFWTLSFVLLKEIVFQKYLHKKKPKILFIQLLYKS